jgi:hypothetical protein
MLRSDFLKQFEKFFGGGKSSVGHVDINGLCYTLIEGISSFEQDQTTAHLEQKTLQGMFLSC